LPTVSVNGVRLNYLQVDDGEAGDGQPPPEDLVMVHGLATSLAFWYLPYAAEFARQFRVTLFDLRGHGRSEMPVAGYTPPQLGRDLAGLLDALGLQRVHLMAHSFGGVVALNLACAQPDRVASLVLADTHIAAARHVETAQDWQFGATIQPMLERHGLDLDTRDPYFGYRLLTRVAQWQVRGFEVPAELLELARPLMGRAGARSAAQWLHLMGSTAAETELMGDDGLTLARLRGLRFPILAMYGDHSQARLTGDELLALWPHAEFRRVRDAGHFFPSSRPEELISGCRRFWGGEFAAAPRRHRAGEAQRGWFRSDRVFRAGDQWYFTTRERSRVGPFAAPEEAREVLAGFMATVQA
jgi:pimeloyl-ACP methyl ester carboxylesterase